MDRLMHTAHLTGNTFADLMSSSDWFNQGFLKDVLVTFARK